MAALTRIRADEDERAYRAHERAVTGMLAARYRDLDPDSRYELYHEAWASVLKRRGDGVEIENLEGYLIGAADKLASKRVYGADARRRVTFDPVEGPYSSTPDAGESPEEAVLAADEARQMRMLIDELDEPERALLKLRLDLGLEPAEIRERLELTDRQYRRIAERAGKALLAQFRAFDSGAWARSKRSLLCACVFGVASERQRAKAQELLEHDPCCRAMMSELRELGGRAAAVLPVPAGPLALDAAHADAGGRAAELFAGAKDHAADLLVGAKQQAAGAYVRMADPTPLAGMRPGAVGAVVAGCIAAGGSAYCAVEGVPGPIGPALGIEQPSEQAETKPPKPKPEASQPAPPPVAPPATPPPAPTAAPPPAQPTTPPPPPPQREFEPEVPAAPAPAPAAPATGGESEFGGP